nr:hypothetical protein B0A51_00314 [Rachicladosporium sp. CCFEE 5018]
MRLLTILRLAVLVLTTLSTYHRYSRNDFVTRLRQVTRPIVASAAYLDEKFLKRYISVVTDDEYTAAIRLKGERVRKEQPWPECAPHSGKRVLRYCFEDEYTMSQMRVEFIGAWAFSLSDNNTALFFVRRFLKQLAEPIETDDDQDFHDWFAADNNLTVAHELGHCFGLLHKHQRPGVYDAWGARDPSIIFRPQYIRGYNVTFKKIRNMTNEPAFDGLDGPARIWALLRNLSLVDKHWPEAGAWAPIDNGEMEHMFYASGGPVDLKSVMIYSSTTGVSVDGKGEARGSIIRDLKTWEDNLDWPQGRRYNQIHPCGTPDPRKCTGPSDGDIARILALYPARGPTTPRDLLEDRALQRVAVGSAYKPMVVIRGDVSRTVRPVAPQTPSKGDYNGYPSGYLAQKSADLDYDTILRRVDHMGIAATRYVTTTLRSTEPMDKTVTVPAAEKSHVQISSSIDAQNAHGRPAAAAGDIVVSICQRRLKRFFSIVTGAGYDARKQGNPIAEVYKLFGAMPSHSLCSVGFMYTSALLWHHTLSLRIPYVAGSQRIPQTLLELDWDEYFTRLAVINMAHELGHAIGLLHEHQRPGMYDNLNYKDPTIILRPQDIEGYTAAFENVSKTSEQAEPTFKDLNNPARINILFSDIGLSERHWPNTTNHVQVSE